ncbi:MAG: S9 family peptidase [Calditrichia bacterium]|nr:S9 family peptidase [Calditrichia bacterium]
MKINQWLQAGPLETPLPAFHQDAFGLKDLLKFEPAEVEKWRPAPGAELVWDHRTRLSWAAVAASEKGFEIGRDSGQKNPQIYYLAAYLDAKRWLKAELQVRSAHPLKAYLDGENVAAKESSDTSEVKDLKQALKLTTGKHLLLLKVLIDPENPAPALLETSLAIDEKFGESPLALGASPQQIMNISLLLDGPKVSGVSISPDGELATVTISEIQRSEGKSKSWLELRRVKDGSLVHTYRGNTALSAVSWAPLGKRFAYLERNGDKTTLWVTDLETGTTTDLLKEIKDFGSFTWSPEGNFIVYSVSEKPEDDKRGVKRLESPRDRWPDFRTKSFLYRANYPGGTRQRLTAGKLTTSLAAVSPDGSRLLFTTYTDNFADRPFIKTTLSLLNLQDLSVDTLWEGGWLSSAQWSPDGKQLLLTGGPSLFGEAGKNVPEGVIPNDYDTQAYLFDLATRKAAPLTRDFDPSINSAAWDKTGENIYFEALDREYVRLFRYSLKEKKFRALDTGVEVLNTFDLAKEQPLAVYYGSSSNVLPKAYLIDLKKNQRRLLSDPAQKDFEGVEFGKVERFTFTSEEGLEIDGRVHYPPDFDPARKYPAIVYYYGGTSPVTRDFGGRYPKELFAAQGYVVYVLQPSGATGYGQAFSARHVNNWGKTVADEIILGTQKFLEAHPFVDEKRVGCIGASYGGFMTLLLLTKTDMFAAGISHAGISDLSSYWGEGFWGYLYNEVAAAHSFPWNRRDIYVDQSPLFHADRVTTPLLLLHGYSDTNVPRGESDQFYLALKLLGKEVEYVQVADQDHWVLDYKKRIIWQQTILAWFDKWLKGQAEWWEDLYAEEKGKG